MRQEVTRAHTAKGWALDGVVLHNDVTRSMKEDITSPPPADIGKRVVVNLMIPQLSDSAVGRRPDFFINSNLHQRHSAE